MTLQATQGAELFSSLLAAGVLLAQAQAPSAGPAAVPAPPASMASSPEAAGRPVVLGRFVPFAERKPVPYESVKGFVFFKLTIAGQEGWALLDTGSQISVVDETFAQAKGLKVETPGARLETYRGGAPLRVVKDVPVVMPGQFETRAPALAVVDLKSMTAGIGHEVDFVFGRDYLATALVMINPGSRTIQLAPSGTLNAPANAPFIPLRDGKLEVEAIIAGKPVILGVDTGSQFPFMLTPEAWERLGPAAGSFDGQVTTDKRGFEVKVADVASIDVGPVHVSQVKVLIQPSLPAAGVDGVIGAPFFDGKLVVIDARVGKMWVIPGRPRQPVDPAQAPASPSSSPAGGH